MLQVCLVKFGRPWVGLDTVALLVGFREYVGEVEVDRIEGLLRTG